MSVGVDLNPPKLHRGSDEALGVTRTDPRQRSCNVLHHLSWEQIHCLVFVAMGNFGFFSGLFRYALN